MKKKNIGLRIRIIVLSLLVVGLGSYIIYDQVISKDNNEEAITMPDESYLGIWIPDENYPDNADELTIWEITEDTIMFSLSLYRIGEVSGQAKIQDNKIIFTDGYVNGVHGSIVIGTLTFNNQTIKLVIEQSNFEDISEGEYMFTFKRSVSDGWHDLIGKYYSSEGVLEEDSYIELKADGTFIHYANMCEGYYEIKGTYVINGITLKLTRTSENGVYNTADFTISGNALIINNVTFDDGIKILPNDPNFYFDCSYATNYKKR